MREIERGALTELTRVNWAISRDGVWEDPETHVAGLNGPAFGTVMDGFHDARASSAESPLGVVVTGQPGSGKTHLVAAVRSRVMAAGGYFFALDLRHERAFWQKVVHDVLGGLLRPGRDGVKQGEALRRGCLKDSICPNPCTGISWGTTNRPGRDSTASSRRWTTSTSSSPSNVDTHCEP
ncbi:hypothetical protein ACFS27_05330 [Promicromonospora vindobonensis]|uniref:IstB-like ATP binding protein n=1 Tax=Promicromonospora vindobonensis TaxID=195748 RepID=A0ABW5VPJ3_9MICO